MVVTICQLQKLLSIRQVALLPQIEMIEPLQGSKLKTQLLDTFL